MIDFLDSIGRRVESIESTLTLLVVLAIANLAATLWGNWKRC